MCWNGKRCFKLDTPKALETQKMSSVADLGVSENVMGFLCPGPYVRFRFAIEEIRSGAFQPQNLAAVLMRVHLLLQPVKWCGIIRWKPNHLKKWYSFGHVCQTVFSESARMAGINRQDAYAADHFSSPSYNLINHLCHVNHANLKKNMWSASRIPLQLFPMTNNSVLAKNLGNSSSVHHIYVTTFEWHTTL